MRHHLSFIVPALLLICMCSRLNGQGTQSELAIADESDQMPRSALKQFSDSAITPNMSPTKGIDNHFLFFDDFKDNQHRWCTGDDTSRELTITDGKYHFKGYNTMGHSSTRYFNINLSEPFSCSAQVRWLSGDTSHGFGLNFCSDQNVKSYYSFMIRANGQYGVRSLEKNGKWQDVIQWTKSDAVQRGAIANFLEIKKESDDSIHFFINNTEVGSVPFDGGFGRGFGCRANDRQTVEFDDFKLEGTERVPNPQGYADSAHLQSPEDKPFFFSDDFSTNQNGWFTKSDTEYDISIADGKMRVESINSKGCYIYKRFDIAANKPLSCSVKVKWLSGKDNYGFGLEYCADMSQKNYYYFDITATGEYAVQFMEKGEGWFNIKPWTSSPAIKTYSEENTLSINIKNDSIHFLINHTEVASAGYTGAYGRAFGFRVNNKEVVEFDDFKLEGVMMQKPPDACSVVLSPDRVFTEKDVAKLEITNRTNDLLHAGVSLEGTMSASSDETDDWTEVMSDVIWMTDGFNKNSVKRYKAIATNNEPDDRADIHVGPLSTTTLTGKFFGKDGVSNPLMKDYQWFRFVVTYSDSEFRKHEFHSKPFAVKRK